MTDPQADRAIEEALDDVGRERVFAIMRAAGWGPHDRPPDWVWWEAVRLVRNGEA